MEIEIVGGQDAVPMESKLVQITIPQPAKVEVTNLARLNQVLAAIQAKQDAAGTEATGIQEKINAVTNALNQ